MAGQIVFATTTLSKDSILQCLSDGKECGFHRQDPHPFKASIAPLDWLKGKLKQWPDHCSQDRTGLLPELVWRTAIKNSWNGPPEQGGAPLLLCPPMLSERILSLAAGVKPLLNTRTVGAVNGQCGRHSRTYLPSTM